MGYGLGMNCLISLLWQFEVPHVPIPVTVLKNYKDIPHHYFYSSKQNRVLRKKNPNAISTLQQSQTQQPQPHLLKTHRNPNCTLQLTLNTGNQSTQTLTDPDFQGQYSIISSTHQLCLYKFNHHTHTTSIQYLMDMPMLGKQEELVRVVGEVVAPMWGNLRDRVLGKIRAKGRKDWGGGQGEVLVAVEMGGVGEFRVLVVDAVRLVFGNGIDTGLEIRYTPIVNKTTFIKPAKQQANQHSQTQQKHEKSQQQIEPSILHNLTKVPSVKKEESPKDPLFQCPCCNRQCLKSDTKQIPNQQYKQLRKQNNMSIRGFNNPYYQICPACYQTL